ncbi:MAG: MBL fold metallo-hydrolase [Longimicrobiales bacterium]|nr:MBL fold metallo-hydrolase [Longimicrobiales bacterium]
MDPKPDTKTETSAGEASGPRERGQENQVTVRCWGTRGSIPSPGPKTVRFGGNTTCLEVNAGEQRLIFDAGSGIRPLGLDIVERGPNAIPIFLTHFHWDHIQGFPFFAPLYDPEDRIRVIGPKQKDIDVQNLFAGQMGPIYFPVPFSFVAAEMEFEHLNDGAYEVGDALLEVIRVRHPSYVVGYRIKVGGRVICFIPDNELEGDMYRELEPGFESRLIDFVGDADLLIHDSMYTEEEYPQRVGWGHSTFEQSLRLALEAGVKKLLFSHHDPTRTDYELEAIIAKMREKAERSGNGLVVEGAMEGVDYRLEEPT